MKYVIVGLILASFMIMSGCKIARAPHPNFAQPLVVDVRVEYVKSGDDFYTTHVQLYNWSDLPGLVSEVYLSRTQTLVEYFDMPNGRFPVGQRDNHSTFNMPNTTASRWIYTYPAEVEDTDMSALGFAELPENRLGTVKSTIDPTRFNADHNSKHQRQGRVVRDARSQGIWWSIRYNSRTKEFYFRMYEPPPWLND
jgi:hypothetical protein